MYTKLASFFAQKLIQVGSVKEEQRDVYEYGLEILLADIGYLIIFLLFATVTGTMLQSLFFLVGFILLRRFAGGYHANTYTKCHIMFLINQMIFTAIIKLVPEHFYFALIISLVSISLVVIWMLAPVDNNTRRFIKNEYNIFRRKSRIYSVVILIMTVTVLFFSKFYSVYICYTLGLFSAACSIIAGSIQRKIAD